MMKHLLFKLFGLQFYSQNDLNTIRANWFCGGESFGMEKTIDYIEKLGHIALAEKLRTEWEETNNKNNTETIRFHNMQQYIQHALDNDDEL